jgi:hypothetical protein
MYNLRRNYVLPFLLFFFCTNVWCTTAIVIVTPQQIIAGTDRLARIGRARDNNFLGRGTVIKTVLLKGRFVVSCVGLEEVINDQLKHQTVFTFADIMRRVDSQLDGNVTMPRLVTLMEMESSSAIRESFPVERLMKNGTIKRGEAFDDVLVQYIVAGYRSGIPTIIHINYTLNWQKYKLIGPNKEIDYPKQGSLQSYFYTAGIQTALREIGKPNSYATQRIVALIGAEWKKLTSDQALTSDESIRIMRTLINIEAEVEPDKVGVGATVVVIPRKGKGSIGEYDGAGLTPPGGGIRFVARRTRAHLP